MKSERRESAQRRAYRCPIHRRVLRVGTNVELVDLGPRPRHSDEDVIVEVVNVREHHGELLEVNETEHRPEVRREDVAILLVGFMKAVCEVPFIDGQLDRGEDVRVKLRAYGCEESWNIDWIGNIFEG